MRAFATAAAALALAGCSNPFADQSIAACEKQLLGKLASPASYERVTAEHLYVPGPDRTTTQYEQVNITYDAANAYNAKLRAEETCIYRPGTVEPMQSFGSGPAVGGSDDFVSNATVDDDMNAVDMNLVDM